MKLLHFTFMRLFSNKCHCISASNFAQRSQKKPLNIPGGYNSHVDTRTTAKRYLGGFEALLLKIIIFFLEANPDLLKTVQIYLRSFPVTLVILYSIILELSQWLSKEVFFTDDHKKEKGRYTTTSFLNLSGLPLSSGGDINIQFKGYLLAVFSGRGTWSSTKQASKVPVLNE